MHAVRVLQGLARHAGQEGTRAFENVMCLVPCCSLSVNATCRLTQ